MLHSLLFTIVENKTDADEAFQLIKICREYSLGLALEQQRRTITINEPNNIKRSLELAAYFTHCSLRTPHSQLALRQAAKQAFKSKNFRTAAQFSTRLLELAPSKKIADEVILKEFFFSKANMTNSFFYNNVCRLAKSSLFVNVT